MNRMSKADLQLSILLWDDARDTPPMPGSPPDFTSRVDNALNDLMESLYPTQHAQDA